MRPPGMDHSPLRGRYTLAGHLADIAARFAAKTSDEGLWDWTPKYNVAPAAVVPVVAFNGAKDRTLVPMRWGLHPQWRKEPPEGRPMFNARVETAKEKPSFRTPYKRRRALIPTTGWYEWERVEMPDGKTVKQPHFIFEDSDDVGSEIFALHHRMPVRLPESQWDDWLDWDAKPDFILEEKLGGGDLGHYEVDRAVGNGRREGADLIRPIAAV